MHQAAAMNLDGSFGNADVVRNLFAEAPPHHLNHNLPLPGAEGLEASPDRGQNLEIFLLCAVAQETELNSVQKFLITKRLCKKLDGSSLHCLHRHRDIAVPGDKYYWKLPARRGELALKIKATLSRQSDIKNQASGAIGYTGLKKIGDTPE